MGGMAPIIRWGVLRIGRFDNVSSLLESLFARFADVGTGILDTVGRIIRDGALAVSEFLNTGTLTPTIMGLTPQIPPATFSMEPSDRVIVAGDIVGIDKSGAETARRLYTVGIDEGSIVEDILSAKARQIYERIKRTDPREAEEFVDRLFEAHWMGRIW